MRSIVRSIPASIVRSIVITIIRAIGAINGAFAPDVLTLLALSGAPALEVLALLALRGPPPWHALGAPPGASLLPVALNVECRPRSRRPPIRSPALPPWKGRGCHRGGGQVLLAALSGARCRRPHTPGSEWGSRSRRPRNPGSEWGSRCRRPRTPGLEWGPLSRSPRTLGPERATPAVHAKRTTGGITASCGPERVPRSRCPPIRGPALLLERPGVTPRGLAGPTRGLEWGPLQTPSHSWP